MASGYHLGGVSMMTGIVPLEDSEVAERPSTSESAPAVATAVAAKQPQEGHERVARTHAAFQNLNYDAVSGARQGAIVPRRNKSQKAVAVNESFR